MVTEGIKAAAEPLQVGATYKYRLHGQEVALVQGETPLSFFFFLAQAI